MAADEPTLSGGAASDGGFAPPRADIRSFAISDGAFILSEDPDLAQMLSPSDRLAATEAFRTPVIGLCEGDWEPTELDPRTTYGLLVLDGLLVRRTRVGRGRVSELLGPGDIVRPWETACPWSFVPARVEWFVSERARLGVLDGYITRLMGKRPELVVAFSNRLLAQSRSAQYLLAVCSLRRVDDRLLGTLWHLASKWGRVTPHGVKVPFRLKHELLAQIVGATRQAVTSALQGLRERGELSSDDRGRYSLMGDPSAWQKASEARPRDRAQSAKSERSSASPTALDR
jgi:CRP/FNR family transcriptional regulator, cyclic AMP receptor protein